MIINWILQPHADGWGEYELDEVVWIDIRRTEILFRLDPDFYIGLGGAGAGQTSRYANIGRHFLSEYPMWMPVLHVDEGGFLKFTDGRHRFAWVRDHGAVALPVATPPPNVARLAALLGSTLRECQIRMW